jgi:hypothetical protein
MDHDWPHHWVKVAAIAELPSQITPRPISQLTERGLSLLVTATEIHLHDGGGGYARDTQIRIAGASARVLACLDVTSPAA